MAGPADQSAKAIIFPAGEEQAIFSANELAYRIQNFELTPERTLKSVLGPTLYEPHRNLATVGDYESGVKTSTGAMDTAHGIFHAGLLGGIADTLIVRAGAYLYRHEGWNRTFQKIYPADSDDKDLTDSSRPEYPDQFVALNNKIIWANGVDGALVISDDGLVTTLGFRSSPGAPIAEGPQQPDAMSKFLRAPNALGYSWPGKIGTTGDFLDGQTGALLSGSWFYYVQWEDIHGNLSALSPVSNRVGVMTIQADPYSAGQQDVGSELDDLKKQFFVRTTGAGPKHCVAVRLYRTPDAIHTADAKPRLVSRIPTNQQIFYPDNTPDVELGDDAVQPIVVPTFRTMCTHQGCLVIGNVLGDPGIVRRSEPGFPGTFPLDSWVYPDSGGAEVTAVTSHNGVLLAFTESSVYSLEKFGFPQPLSQGVGCVAPRSIKALGDGTLIWLGRDGFYGMKANTISLLSQEIRNTIKNHVNKVRMRTAVAVIDPVSGEYRCALAPAGETGNTLILTYDGTNWKRQTVGIKIADMCRVDDWRQYLLAVAKDVITDKNDVYLLDRETRSYAPGDRKVVYRSGWIKGDQTGMSLIHVRTMYIGMIDAWNGNATIRFYRNGSWSPVAEMNDVRAIGPDDSSRIVIDIAGGAKIGSAKTRLPRLFWRQIPVNIENANSWAFEISANYPTKLHLASFAFDISTVGFGNTKSRIPRRSDL